MSNYRRENRLKILQYNVQRSRNKVMIDLLEQEEVLNADILAIQEPWRNRTTEEGYNPHPERFRLIEKNSSKTRAAIYISRRLREQDYEPITVEEDRVSIRLKIKGRRTITVHSVYCPPLESHSTRLPTSQLSDIIEALQTKEDHLLVGDINLHHPAWGGEGVTPHHLAGELLEKMEDQDITLTLEKGTITRDTSKRLGNGEHRRETSTVDLVLCSRRLAHKIVKCQVRRDLHTGSDHLPIETVIALEATVEQKKNQCYNWKKLDAEKFREKFAQNNHFQPRVGNRDHTESGRFTEQLPEHVQTIAAPQGSLNPSEPPVHQNWQALPLKNHRDIDVYVENLTQTIWEAIKTATPLAGSSKYDKLWWTAECEKAVREARRHRWTAHYTKKWRDIDQAHQAEIQKAKVLRRAKRIAWRTMTEEAARDPKKLWKLNRKMKSRAQGERRQDYFPTLERNGQIATSVEDKVQMLREECFPPPPEVDLSDIEGFIYPGELKTLDKISLEEVETAAARLKPDKTPGPDGIPNRVIKLVCAQKGEEIARLFTACLRLGYHPTAFKTASTVVLRKPGKPNYADPSTYRPIALLNTLGKTLEAIIAARITRLTESFLLLPDTQYGARPGRSTESALLNITEQVYAIWKRNRNSVATILSLDVSKAFDRVSHQRLIHNLRKRKIPELIRNWVASFLENRRTTIRLADYTSPEEAIQVGIPQGSPISPILYLFYNADLVEDCQRPALYSSVTAFVDDTNILVYSRTTKENCRKLQELHNFCTKWSRTHGSKFNVSKYGLLHISRQRRGDLERALQLEEVTVIPKTQLRLLGVTLDTRLDGKAHLKRVEEKLPALLATISSLSGSTWGPPLNDIKRVYLTAIRPALMYGALTWYRPPEHFKGAKARATKLQAIQGQCLRRIAGAYRATATEALEAELGIVPLDLYAKSTIYKAATRAEQSKTIYTIDSRANNILNPLGRRGRRTAKDSPFTRIRQWIRKRAAAVGVQLERERESIAVQKVKRLLSNDIQKEWEQRWAQGTKGTHSRELQPQLDKRVPRILQGMRKFESTLVIQLRTGKIGFNAFLYKRGVPGLDDPQCTHCNNGDDMTVEHVVLKCSKWREERNRALVGLPRSSLRRLLETRRGCLAAARIIQATRLLAQYRHCEEMEDEKGGEEEEEENTFG
jgi:exonuclease III